MWGPIIAGTIGATAGLIGADRQDDAIRDANEANAALQREFAQNGIRWRVADAQAAGIHPLYAIGANTMSASPSYIGETNMGAAMANIGQDLSRAINATRTKDEREDTYSKLRLEHAALENELLRSQIARINAAPNPGLPSNSEMPGLTGQGDARPTSSGASSGYVQENPLSRMHSQPGRPAQDVGAITDYAYVRTPTGYAIVPSKDVKERIEDQFIPEAMWSFRNQILPFWEGHPEPDPRYYKLPPGYDRWEWVPWAQEFRPSRRSKPIVPWRGLEDRKRDRR